MNFQIDMKTLRCKFTPLEFETFRAVGLRQPRLLCKFTPLEFETVCGMLC